ncbi:MAG TPA: YceI family protein [Gemmatimonadaceae bacterium]
MGTSTNWTIDTTHSTAEFAVKHLMISTVKGRFGKVDGTVSVTDATPAVVAVDVTIPVASIDTREEKRDAHLRSPDFFDAEKFPTITFKSTGFSGSTTAEFQLTGNLTIHGVTRAVTLKGEAAGTVKDPWGGERSGFSAATKINRKDFGLTWNAALEAGGVVVGEEVKISIEVELVKQAAVAAA